MKWYSSDEMFGELRKKIRKEELESLIGILPSDIDCDKYKTERILN